MWLSAKGRLARWLGLVLLPWLLVAPNQCGMSRAAMVAVDAWMELNGPRAMHLYCDPRLAQAAQQHADWLDVRPNELVEQSLHIGDGGSTANERAERAGYDLPDWWGPGNYVESVIFWPTKRNANGADSLRILAQSPSHYAHLTGQGWYAGSVVYGFGYSSRALVVLIAPVEE